MFSLKKLLFTLLCGLLPHQLFSASRSLKPLALREMEMSAVCYADPEKNCAICKESLAEEGQTKRLTCSHKYHKECIDPWLSKPGSEYRCPVCRARALPAISLVEAGTRCDTLALTLLLGAALHPDRRDESGQTALMMVSYHGDVGAMAQLLSVHANPSAANKFGKTVLMYAVEGGSAAAVDALLNAGVICYGVSEKIMSPLQLAVTRGNSEVVKRLMVAYDKQCDAWWMRAQSGYFLMEMHCKPFYDDWHYAESHASPAIRDLIRPIWDRYYGREFSPPMH